MLKLRNLVSVLNKLSSKEKHLCLRSWDTDHLSLHKIPIFTDLFPPVLASSITADRQILFQTYLQNFRHACVQRGVYLSTFTSPWRHRSGRFSPIDRRSLISSLLFFFSFSRLLIVFCPPVLPFPIAIKCYRLETAQHVEERCMYHAAVFGAVGGFAAVIGCPNAMLD